MEFVNENLPKLIVAGVILTFVVVMFLRMCPKKCPCCGKRAVRLKRNQCCSSCHCEHEGSYVCDLCQATFKDLDELKAKRLDSELG